MLELGVDEITLVLQASESIKERLQKGLSIWEEQAEIMISVFERKSGFLTAFGEKIGQSHAPEGYTVAYQYGEHGFYMAVGYHDIAVGMGIVIKLSAQAYDYYRDVTGEELYDFLNNIRDNRYTFRLSRIDFTADFIDEGINPTDIYKDLEAERIVPVHEYLSKQTGTIKLRKANLKLQGFCKQDEIPTLYLGSSQSNAQLRVYDKRREQIDRKGTKLDKARGCRNWTRFEAIYRGEYAHQITDALMEVHNDGEYSELIARTIVSKFRFRCVSNGQYTGGIPKYSKTLEDAVGKSNLILRAPTSRNFDLIKSIEYLIYGSGFMPTLYKLCVIWGNTAKGKLYKVFDEHLEKHYEANDDCQKWIEEHASDYKWSFMDVNDMLSHIDHNKGK